MYKSKLRLLGMSALVGAGLIATGPANAAQFNLGDVQVTIDNTMSVGVSISAADREDKYLPATNGGPVDSSIYFNEGAGAGVAWTGTENTTSGAAATGADIGNGLVLGSDDFDTTCMVLGSFCQEVDGKENFDGSINTDDGRLNFENGDIFSGVTKLTTEIYMSAGNLSALVRGNAYYDAIMDDDSSFLRDTSGTTYRDNVANLTVLDAYLSYDSDIANMPATVRVGRQVINWGESTFFLGGNSVFSPIDVAAIRRPGAEIKEALLPVEAIYGSLAVTDALSIETYYGGWDDFKLDSGGTFNAGSDFINGGGANGDRIFSGGSAYSGSRIVCDPSEAAAAGMDATAAIAAAILNTGVVSADANVTTASGNGCGDRTHSDVLARHEVGASEYNRKNSNDFAYGTLVADNEGEESFGLALRYYAENLNSTEFGLYYQKYDSRIPYFRVNTGRPKVAFGATGPTSSVLGRGVGMFGCFDAYTGGDFAALGPLAPDYADTPGQLPARFHLGETASGVDPESIMVDDSDNLLGAMRGLLDNSDVQTGHATASTVYAGTAAVYGALTAQQEAALDLDPGTGALLSGLFTAFSNALDPTNAAYYGAPKAKQGTIAEMSELYCLLGLSQINAQVDNATDADFAAYDFVGQLPTGAVLPSMGWNIDFALEYPTIEVYGASFNTTAFGWGIQGEVAVRPEMPLFFDGDASFIHGIFNTCGLGLLNAVEKAYSIQGTYADGGCSGSSSAKGYTTEHDVINWDIGTTATFTRSNPIVSALGADIAILLTEFGGVEADGIEEERGTTDYHVRGAKTPLASVCTSGNDLPLNGVLSIDTNPKKVCRPNDSSMGGLVYFQLQYNNVFGTPLGVQPTLVYSEGLKGNSPAPAAAWREGVSTAAVSLNFSYLDSIRGSVSYRMNDGDEKYTRNNDRDQIGVNVSYAF